MAETSWPFDSGATYEDGWSQMARLWAPSCVEGGSLNQLNYTNSSGFVGQLDTGTAFVRGFAYKNDAALSKTHANPPGTGGFSRRDIVVLRLDRSANTVTCQIVAGTAAASPVDPTLTQNDATGIWEFPLWRVILTNGGANFTSITDLRGIRGSEGAPIWTNLTGWAAGANVGSPVPQWTKEPGSGLVTLRGQLNATTTFAPSGIQIMSSPPVPIRTPNGTLVPIATNFASANHPARLGIFNDIQLWVSTSDSISSIYLDGVSYYA